jgi:condensation domain-containing protein/tubulysin polyketide synthase-like protein
MTVSELFAELAQKGVQLSANGKDLTIRAPKGVLTPLLREELGRNKTEILARLQQEMANLAPAQIAPKPQDRYLPFPLTDMQQAYWIGRTDSIELGQVSCQVYCEIELANADVSRLNGAWRLLIERHDMLRAVIRPDGQQQILKDVPPYLFEVLDLAGRDSDDVASELERIRGEMSHRLTPADRWPLFEIRITRLDSRRTRLHFRMELIIVDAWSIGFLLRDWFQLYLDEDPTSQPVEISFRDYVLSEIAAEQSSDYRRAEEYWLKRLSTLPPAPDLPLAQSPSRISKPRFVRRSAELDATLWQRLKARAAQAGLTPSLVICAAFSEILYTWSKSPDFTLNLTFFNRPATHPQLMDLVGDFTSTILLEVRHTGKTFEERARSLQAQLHRDLEYSKYSGVRVLRKMHQRTERSKRRRFAVVFLGRCRLQYQPNPSGLD